MPNVCIIIINKFTFLKSLLKYDSNLALPFTH